jgi:hypothetical protein
MGFLGHRTGNTGGGVGSCVIDKPTECTTGSWLVLVTNTNCLDGTHVISPPDATWQLIIDKQAGTNGSLASHMHVWMKKVLASEAGVSGPSTYTFTVAGGARTWSWGISAWDGLDKSAPVSNEGSDADGNASDTTIPCPTRSSLYANSVVMRIATIRANCTFTDLGGGYNNRVQINPGGGTGPNFAINLQDTTQAAVGPAGLQTITASVAAQHVGATLILAPPQPVVSTLAPDGVAAQSGYADATTGNISRVQGDPDSAGGTGFTAS